MSDVNSGGRSKLYEAQGKYEELQKAGSSPHSDEELHSKWHNRSYNPIDDAERGNVSEKLNADSAKYKKGPGPL